MSQRPPSSGWRAGFCLCGWIVICSLTGCGAGTIHFLYPSERAEFPSWTQSPATVYFGLIRDMRPVAQKEGRGRFVGITFPSDSAWERPVTQIFRDAFTQDILQTQLVELVPLGAQADYSLEADILSFGCRLQRRPTSFLIPVALGMGVGMAVGEDVSGRLKRGGVFSLAGLMALPMPADHRATAEVRVRLRDGQGDVVWEQTCQGEVNDQTYLAATSREDQKLVDRFLTRALKRCNACLLGQMRQEFLAPPD